MIKKNEPVQVSNDEFEYQIDDEFVIVDLENDDDTNNTMGEVFQAFKKSISKLKNKDKTPFFKTIMIDTGQYERLLSKINTEGEVAFPACFIRFTNVHFLVSQQRIGEGRCMVRVRFVLNRMDHRSEERRVGKECRL